MTGGRLLLLVEEEEGSCLLCRETIIMFECCFI